MAVDLNFGRIDMTSMRINSIFPGWSAHSGCASVLPRAVSTAKPCACSFTAQSLSKSMSSSMIRMVARGLDTSSCVEVIRVLRFVNVLSAMMTYPRGTARRSLLIKSLAPVRSSIGSRTHRALLAPKAFVSASCVVNGFVKRETQAAGDLRTREEIEKIIVTT